MGNVLYFMEKRYVFIGFESPQKARFSGQEALKGLHGEDESDV
jgi:hypothetical protein